MSRPRCWSSSLRRRATLATSTTRLSRRRSEPEYDRESGGALSAGSGGAYARMTVAGPLSGVTVIDLTRVLAGPFCTLILSDLGARVIKVEDPDGGDLSRALGPWIHGASGYFLSVNRGKESIALDLKKPDDLAILHRLLARGDVLVENFRAGVMDKLGLGWEA